MDLIDYDEQVFNTIRKSFTNFFDQLQDLRLPHLYFVPVSALTGDNVVHSTTAMPWYSGPSLLELLESVPAAEAGASDPFRLAVQRVLRPSQNFRGFAGQIAAGTVRPGDSIMVLPSRRTSRVQSIVTFDGDLLEAYAPQSVTLTLTDELDISRGDLLVSPESPAIITTRFTASLIWMDEQPLDLTRRYLLKHTSRTVQAQVTAVLHRLDVATLEQQPAATLTLNGIGLVEIESVQPLTVDRYSTNRTTGSFVLIDPVNNATVAAGMIRDTTAEAFTSPTIPVSAAERAARWLHVGAHLHLTGPASFADAVERVLFLRGAFIVRPTSPSPKTLTALTAVGALILTHTPADAQTIILGDQQATVSTVENLLRFLESHAILQGEIKR
jgi:sulfate adenylyltransferase subunit 1 (EFTu-like GTPase family)